MGSWSLASHLPGRAGTGAASAVGRPAPRGLDRSRAGSRWGCSQHLSLSRRGTKQICFWVISTGKMFAVKTFRCCLIRSVTGGLSAVVHTLYSWLARAASGHSPGCPLHSPGCPLHSSGRPLRRARPPLGLLASSSPAVESSHGSLPKPLPDCTCVFWRTGLWVEDIGSRIFGGEKFQIRVLWLRCF